MTLINLTPHPITLIQGELVTVYPKEPVPARVSQQVTYSYVEDGILYEKIEFGPVSFLPAPVKNARYIVSAMVKSACPDRMDLVSPGELVRNSDENIIGCKSFYY